MASVAIARPGIPLSLVPLFLCVAMWSASAVTWALGGPSPAALVWPYVSGALVACTVSVFVFSFVEVAKSAKSRADSPLQKVWSKLKPRLPLLAVPAFILPLFLAAYTSVKSAIPVTVGYRYDPLFANMDAAIFGVDPWQVTHSVIGPAAMPMLELMYVPLWLTALAYVKALVALFADRTMAITFFTAALLTWFFGGFICAYLFSAAGPTFTDLNGVELRFVGIRASLLETAGLSSPFLTGPAYLEEAMLSGEAYPGGGISAMPSMHIAACTLYCLAARETRWFIPAAAFLAIIFVGSIHSGYHYAVDAPVAALIAYLCWKFSGRIYEGAVVLK